jgi:hypothetical protein
MDIIACEKSNAAHCFPYATSLRILANRSTMPKKLRPLVSGELLQRWS